MPLEPLLVLGLVLLMPWSGSPSLTITPLDQRGYYFGIGGIAVAFGNGLGLVVGGVLTEKTLWRWEFWFICLLVAADIFYLSLVLPESTAPGSIWKKLRMVDWLGAFTSMAGIICILVSWTPSILVCSLLYD